MDILYIHSLMFPQRTWRRVARRLAEVGITLNLVPQTAAETAVDEGKIDLLILDLSTGGNLPAHWEAVPHRICVSAGGAVAEAPAPFTTFDADTVAEFGQYLAAVSLDNYFNGICFLAARLGQKVVYDPPKRVATTGIYHPRAEEIFTHAAAYWDWYCRHRPDSKPLWVGLLSYHGQIAEENTADLDALILALEDCGQAPATGQEILAEIMDRKALSEFRWTTVAEIMAKGGALALMGAEDYQPWFERLPAAARDKVLADWGPFPGDGMAAEHEGRAVLVITGIKYGKVRIMVQPKRGCYGPKCTGEVCRILHDPELAPPHHWLATYRYIQTHSDAVVHVGTEGALEFLPGKQNALGETCFPEISLGDLPNLYLYVMDAIGEGIIAKRRGQAILVDHLTPVYRPAPLDEALGRLEPLLDAFQRAAQMGEEARQRKIAGEIAPLLVACGLAEEAPAETDLPQFIDTARRRMAAIRRSLMPEGLHTLGAPPNAAGRSRMLAHLLLSPPPGLPTLAQIAGSSEAETDSATYERATAVLEGLLGDGEAGEIPSEHQSLATFCREVDRRLDGCRAEIDQLLRGLAGRFIAPGLSGSLSRGKVDALPTGRNFFATDVTCLPTPAAWEIGRRMADDLLRKYLEEENRFPESVGISIWSSDAFKSDGELLCQILALLGVRPVWDPQGRVTRLEPMDLTALVLETADGSRRDRPRVDVTVQTSSLMRDLVPNFMDLMDRAVLLVSELDEPEARNFIRKHSRAQLAKLRQETAAAISDAKLRRLATVLGRPRLHCRGYRCRFARLW